MTADSDEEQKLFRLAFELAFCIHADKEVAFFVAEDALDGLASTVSRQGKNRKPSERLRGFLKWGERTRPVRKTVRLGEEQMLQWLVYKHSEPWERQTERGEGLYLPTEDDMIVRYVKHLVFLTLRRGSFYVTLAVGSLLHQLNRRETRLFYDILTQSDPARMKDASYIGKQRLELLERVSRRFGQMIRTAQRPGEEKQFVTRPATRCVVELVSESLRCFAPRGTACVVEPGFEVTDIPGLYFSEAGAHDEELIELNRIRTVLDPACFARFCEGLSKYVRTLPDEVQDRNCNYDAPDERLAVPQFSGLPAGRPRGDRFQPPRLTKADYIRLRRTLDARANRKRDFSPRQLSVYVDDAHAFSFDPKATRRVRRVVGAGAGVVEVRGSDAGGELTLATFLIGDGQFAGEEFGASVVQTGGQKVGVRLRPFGETNGNGGRAQLEVSYRETGFARAASRLSRRVLFGSGGTEGVSERSSERFGSGHGRWARVGAALALMVVTSALAWWWLSRTPSRREVKLQELSKGPEVEEQVKQKEQAGEERVEVKPPVASATPSPMPRQSKGIEAAGALLARATWSTDREAALHAVTVEPTRGKTQPIDLSRVETKVVLSLPLYDDAGRAYSRYRLTLSSAESRLWQQTLRAPKLSLTGYAHVLSLTLFNRRLPAAGAYDLKVEGSAQDGWRPLGHVTFGQKAK